jgi:four helix bundle protein
MIMDNITRSKIFEDRLTSFSISIILTIKNLPKTSENKIITSQLVRSSTSIGANYAEAINAISKMDFRNKIFISKKEASETRYWLRILEATNPELDASNELGEINELLLILQKIVSTLKHTKSARENG